MNYAHGLAVRCIKLFEGCRLDAYLCPAGVWTIGWGETRGVRQGDKWTQAYADARLDERVTEFMMDVLAVCPQLHGAKLAACTSLAYNIGVAAFKGSTVARRVKRLEWQGAADAMLMWNKSRGRILKGLVRRREYERQLFLSE